MRVTFLGTGTSHGIPMIGCDCTVCRSDNPRNQRLRPSVYIENDSQCLLVDATTYFRAQATLLSVLVITLLGIGCASGPRPIAWDRLPFPKDSNWGGSQGAPAITEGDAMVLQGQDVRTSRIYQLPSTIDFDFEIAKGAVPDGGLLFEFAPTNSPTDIDLPRLTTLGISYQSPTAASVESSGALLVYVKDSSAPARPVWGPVPFTCEEGRFYHLHLEARIDGLKIVTDQGAEQIDLKIPYGKFFIQMGGWKPPSRWYMRNFSIH